MPPAVDALIVDASPDAPRPAPEPLLIYYCGDTIGAGGPPCDTTPITEHTFPDLRVGETAFAYLKVHSFQLINSGTTGAGLTLSELPPAIYELRFQPTTPGAFTGTATFTAPHPKQQFPPSYGVLTVHANVLP